MNNSPAERDFAPLNLFNEIIDLENLFLAWREFRRGKRGKFDVQIFERNLEDNLFILHQELKSGTYRHGDYTSFYITDPKLRKIHTSLKTSPVKFREQYYLNLLTINNLSRQRQLV